jgi:hypothetical protein
VGTLHFIGCCLRGSFILLEHSTCTLSYCATINACYQDACWQDAQSHWLLLHGSCTLHQHAQPHSAQQSNHACRTRKSAADASAELASKQISLSAASSQLASAQAQLDGVEGSLAAKRKELAEVLGQLQAAAVQEFQDAKKLLLEEGELIATLVTQSIPGSHKSARR